MNTKISIITVNKNNLTGLRKTYESVVNQSYDNYEYIIIDGDSSDGSVEFIHKHKDNIHYWLSEPDDGIFSAMNKGIKKATGDYCIFMNSGDWFSDNNILSNIPFNEFKKVDIIYGDALFLDESEGASKYKLPDFLSVYFLYFNSICHQSTFIKRKLFSKYTLYNESFKIVSDWEFILKLRLTEYIVFKHLPVTVSYYQLGGMSTDKKLVNSERDIVLSKLFSPIIRKDYESFKEFTSLSLIAKSSLIKTKLGRKISLFIIKIILKIERLFYKLS